MKPQSPHGNLLAPSSDEGSAFILFKWDTGPGTADTTVFSSILGKPSIIRQFSPPARKPTSTSPILTFDLKSLSYGFDRQADGDPSLQRNKVDAAFRSTLYKNCSEHGENIKILPLEVVFLF